jgi:peptidoglycan/xylan/chitin deacetylase (PgdA/CDA1 family)
VTDPDRAERPVPDDHEFALLLTHDVDRPYKTYQSAYYALTQPERRGYHLRTALPGENPYWQFETVTALEEDLGVRSAFYFLSEQRLFRDRPVREWASMRGWQLYAGRYDLTDPEVAAVVEDLDERGWEVGLHGSFESYRDRDRLAWEKARVERVLGRPVTGGRQHYLNLDRPETWKRQSSLGLAYDASLGSSDDYGFQHGYGIKRPFDDEFVVFPLTAMEAALPDPGEDFDRAWAACESLLEEAREHGAVMTVLWHPRHFSHGDFPGHLRLYRRLVASALDMGAWVGPPRDLYEAERLDRLTRPASEVG